MQQSSTFSASRIWLARSLAVIADIVQIAVAPASVEGVFSPIADGIDLAMAVLLTVLLGWHISFIPSFIVKLLPVADLAPTWTIAALIATRGRSAPANHEAEIPKLPTGGEPRL